MKLVTKYQISAINSCWEKCDGKCAYMFNVYKNQLSRQTGSRNLTGPIVGSIFGPIRFLLPVCRLCWFLYTLNIYAHFSSHFSKQLLMTGIWYLVTGPKTLPTIWHTYMKLVTKYQIPVINSCLEKCDEKWAYTNVYYGVTFNSLLVTDFRLLPARNRSPFKYCDHLDASLYVKIA
jgi:hypothetical protein